jgi:hypothetical protein
MRDQLFKDNYLIVDNFLTPEQAKDLYEAFKRDAEKYPELFIYDDNQAPNSISIYDYRYFVEVLVDKASSISYVMGEPMLPTYSYARIYKNGEELKKHVDRKACEISASIHLGSDGTSWPIWFTKPNGETISVELKPGQGVIYLGCESVHWREAFTGQEYGQLFIHYVRSRGENGQYYFDKIKSEDMK